ncbi:hypothetical protein FOS14_01460 [Skermania sp. ID1734]|uniref:anti-sigma-D factor RsdA n=1 Tax=Skermania sp. ID1734 TaxID=2597516 RepID=UPI00117C427C|nr:anti-sigma-D factor RsdA [Skermania sp. ID1734]TSE02078.1 hypothetical protein FOS14_01460 [Skermania sp. ID1734]
MARDNKRGNNGSRRVDPYAGMSGDSGPVDIAAVRRDDELIDAIAGDGPVATGSSEEFQVAALLANWRAEIVTPPMPAGPDLDEIVALVNQEIGARQARTVGGPRLRLVRPILGAAAAIAVVVGGMTAFSYNASPGDPLWKVKQVVFSEQADSTMANLDATNDLDQARQLISQGDPIQAKQHLDSVQTRIPDVKDPSQHDDLVKRFNDLMDQLKKQLPVLPGAPAASTAPSSATSGTSASATSGQSNGASATTPASAPTSAGPVLPLPPGLPTLPSLPTIPGLPTSIVTESTGQSAPAQTAPSTATEGSTAPATGTKSDSASEQTAPTTPASVPVSTTQEQTKQQQTKQQQTQQQSAATSSVVP